MGTNNINTGWLSGNYTHPGGGVGLVQWDGGRRPAYINYAGDHNANKKDILPQLNYVWYELNHGYKQSTLAPMQGTNDPGEAAFLFHAHYEISSDTRQMILGRMRDAQKIYDKYSGTNILVDSNSPCEAVVNNSLSPACATASGNARIICAAERYDPVSYHEYMGHPGENQAGHQGGEGWHKSCPVIGPSCYLDCSGLVDVALYDVYGLNTGESTRTERADIGKYWEKVSFAEIGPGDLIQPFVGHVEIIDHVVKNTIYTFGAHTDNRPQPKQVGPGKYSNNSSRLYLRYIGPGSQTNVKQAQ
jgi:hypothetical protein